MNRIASLVLVGMAAAGSAQAADVDLSKLPPVSTKNDVTYAKDIRPIFESTCFRCHGSERHRGGLRLDSLQAILQGGDDGDVITPGKSKESPLVIAVAQLDEDTAMPPKRMPGQGGPGNMLARQMITQGDKNDDKKLNKEEFTALANAWFDKLDADKAGKLTQEQFVSKFGQLLPPPREGGRQREGGGDRPNGGPGGREGRGGPGGPNGGRGGPGGPGGMGPAGFIAPGFFKAADSNKDGTLTRSEFEQSFGKWFDQWDSEKSGSLDEKQLRDGLNKVLPPPNFGPGGPGGFGGAGRPGGRGGPNGRGPGGPGGPGGPNGRGPGGPGGFGGGPGGPGGAPPKPLTPAQVGLIRAWIDQGAK